MYEFMYMLNENFFFSNETHGKQKPELDKSSTMKKYIENTESAKKISLFTRFNRNYTYM